MQLLGVRVETADVLPQLFQMLAVPRHILGVLVQAIMLLRESGLFGDKHFVFVVKLSLNRHWM